MLRAFRWSARWFSSSVVSPIKAHELPPRPKISEEDVEEVFLKGGGKGGQKINKTNSKVQLKHIPTGLVVSSQYSRSREQNRARAREILALKVEQLSVPPGESRSDIVAQYKQNKARNKKRKAKKKYLALAEEKRPQVEQDTSARVEGSEVLRVEPEPQDKPIP